MASRDTKLFVHYAVIKVIFPIQSQSESIVLISTYTIFRHTEHEIADGLVH